MKTTIEIELENGYFYARWYNTSIVGVEKTMKKAIDESFKEAKLTLETYKKIPEHQQSYGVQCLIHRLAVWLSRAKKKAT